MIDTHVTPPNSLTPEHVNPLTCMFSALAGSVACAELWGCAGWLVQLALSLGFESEFSSTRDLG